jgi:hypothetical protein
MALYLVVAHQTAASPELVSRLKRLAARDRDAAFVLLVPATPGRHLLSWVEGEGENVARARASEAGAALRGAGLRVRETHIGAQDPLEAVRAELQTAREPYALVVVSTLPQGISRWLRRDLPSQIRHLGMPVVHVTSSVPSSRPGAQPDIDFTRLPAADRPLGLPDLYAWLGAPVYCRDGVLGDLRDVLYDYVNGEPVWLGIASRPLPFRTLLVPARAACVADHRLVALLQRAFVLGQPHVDVGEGFDSLTDEEHIYHYFGLPFDEVRDIRVLREGQAFPGMHGSWQNIIETGSAPSQR